MKFNCCSEVQLKRNHAHWEDDEESDFVEKIKTCMFIRLNLQKLLKEQKSLVKAFDDLNKYSSSLITHGETMSDVNNPLRVSLAVHLFGKFFRESTTDMERELNEGIRKSVYQPLRSVYEIELEEVHSRKEEFIKVKQNWISKNEEYSRELKKENSKKMSSIEDLKATLSQLTHRLEDARTHLEKSVVNALTRMEGPVTDSLVESVPKLQKVFFDLSEIQPAEAKLPPLLNSYELVRRSKSMKEDVSKTPGEKTEEREAK